MHQILMNVSKWPMTSLVEKNRRECTNVYVAVELGYAMIQAAKHTVY